MSIEITTTSGAELSEPEDQEKPAPAVEETTEQKESKESGSEEKEEEEEEKSGGESEEKEAKSDDSEDENEEKEKPKKKGGFQRKIDKLTARVSDREKELGYWKDLALKEKSAVDDIQEPEYSETTLINERPDPDDFENHSDYIEALTDFKVNQIEITRKEKELKSQIQNEQEKIVSDYSERVKIFSDKTEDFDEVLESTDEILMSPTIQQVILSSENGPELIYELCKDREEYARICKLHPIQAAQALGRFEAKLSSPSSTETKHEKKLTKAPSPIKPVGSKGGPVGKSIYDPSLSQKEYEAIRAKQRSA